MSENAYLSTHLPGVAGGVVSIAVAEAGVKVIKTGLKVVRAATACLKADGFAANEEGLVGVNWGGSLNPGEIRIVVEKTTGAPADSAVDVAFTAIGDR